MDWEGGRRRNAKAVPRSVARPPSSEGRGTEGTDGKRGVSHRVCGDILVIVICAVVCHAESWVDIEEFGGAKEEWLKQFLELPNGIPSHDIFGRVFGLLDPDQFRKGFLSWIQAVQ